MNSSETFDLQIISLVYGGDAMARLPDGRAVFLPFTLPGEKVRVRLIEDRRNYARGEVLEVLETSPERVLPRCKHFGECGGCHYQHLPYALQLATKQAILKEQFSRIAGMPDAPVQPMVPSPEVWHYRNAIQFHLGVDGHLGFNKQLSNQVIQIDECYLPEPVLGEVWPKLEFDAGLPLQRIGMKAGSDEEILVTLESNQVALGEIVIEDLPISVVHLAQDSRVVVAGSPWVAREILGRVFRVSAESFFQVNTVVAASLVTAVIEQAPEGMYAEVLDLYCGVGLFSAFLAPRTKRLVGVEVSKEACEDFVANLDEYEHVELYEAPVEAVLGIANIHPALVIVDPPRTGLGKQVASQLVELKPRKILYISCDPSTLARDAIVLSKGGYGLKSVTPFDMFPQTYHIESLSVWEAA